MISISGTTPPFSVNRKKKGNKKKKQDGSTDKAYMAFPVRFFVAFSLPTSARHRLHRRTVSDVQDISFIESVQLELKINCRVFESHAVDNAYCCHKFVATKCYGLAVETRLQRLTGPNMKSIKHCREKATRTPVHQHSDLPQAFCCSLWITVMEDHTEFNRSASTADTPTESSFEQNDDDMERNRHKAAVSGAMLQFRVLIIKQPECLSSAKYLHPLLQWKDQLQTTPRYIQKK